MGDDRDHRRDGPEHDRRERVRRAPAGDRRGADRRRGVATSAWTRPRPGCSPASRSSKRSRDAVRDAEIDRLVVDPVFISKHGDPLLHADAVEALRRSIVPLAMVVTPNAHEAAGLAGMAEVRTHADQVAGRADDPRARRARGAREGRARRRARRRRRARDVRTGSASSRRPRLDTPEHARDRLHAVGGDRGGLGARARDLETAVGDAKEFVTGAIEHSLAIGKGIGPVNPSWRLDASG